MKKLLIMLLVLCLAVGLLPTTVLAADPPTGTAESEPVLLGTEAEYASTIATMFDENGLRKVSVGFNGNDGTLNYRVGLVNKYGNFVVQPIYTSIDLETKDDRLGNHGATVRPFYFIGGYTQAVRDGKMGLLNTRGEEVVPCQYDFVQLPSEGVCAVFNKKDKETDYLGYWSIEQNREIMTPKKYISAYKNTPLASDNVGTSERKPDGGHYMVHDFIGGYAMVTTDTAKGIFVQATIVDKNGKEILPRTYMVEMSTGFRSYPQKSEYLSFVEPKDFSAYRFTKLHNEWGPAKNTPLTEPKSFATGLVGRAGILIPATYTTGVLASPGEAQFFINPATFHIIWEEGLIRTQKDALEGFLYGGAFGVIDLKGNTVLPFTHTVNQELRYDPKEKVFIGMLGTLYNIKGKRLNQHELRSFQNGYAIGEDLGDFSKTKDTYARTYYMVRPDGAELNINKALGLELYSRDHEFSDASTSGLVWVKNTSGMWGLIDFSGKTVLPFEYAGVNHNAWAAGENGFARVNKTKDGKMGLVNAKGKLVLPMEYDRIDNLGINGAVAEIVNEKGQGLVEIQTGRIIVQPQYERFGSLSMDKQPNPTRFANDVYVAQTGETRYLLDANGKELFSSTRTFYEAKEGLYYFTDTKDRFDNRGRVIVPGHIWGTRHLEVALSYTIVVKDGKVYRTSANYLPSTYGFKPAAPDTTAAPSATKLVVNGKAVATAAYAIGGNNYIKLRDLATMVSGTEKNFNVTWDGAKNAVNLLSGKAYVPVGGEMAAAGSGSKAAVRPNSKIFMDGKEVSMTAYAIDGNNYFKLRDVMQLFDIAVGWDNATATATIDTAAPYALAAYEQSKQDAHNKAYESASGTPYEAKPMYKESFIRFETIPTKILYKVGEAFDSAGFTVKSVDIYGRSTDIAKDIELKIGSTKIQDGYELKSAGEKTVDCYYEGKKQNAFKISVVAADSNLLADGDYDIKLQGKYMYPVGNGATYYMELSDQKPEKPFHVELIRVDADRGPLYTITYDGAYVMQPTTQDGAQLQTSGVPHQWRINQYSTFCTIRDYGNQKLLVNASGEQSSNGTKIIVWRSEGKAPAHAKLTFVPAT